MSGDKIITLALKILLLIRQMLLDQDFQRRYAIHISAPKGAAKQQKVKFKVQKDWSFLSWMHISYPVSLKNCRFNQTSNLNFMQALVLQRCKVSHFNSQSRNICFLFHANLCFFTMILICMNFICICAHGFEIIGYVQHFVPVMRSKYHQITS